MLARAHNQLKANTSIGALVAGLVFASAAHAASAPSPAAPVASAQGLATPETADAHAEGGVQDIVVTARKRSESAQTIPVAITALSAETIRTRDLSSLEKVAAFTPQLSVGRFSNGAGAQLTLRGIGTSATSIGIEQSVAVTVDDVYYGQGRIINEGFFDLEGIQILKGPQALFYGKNATAGVVSITTAGPSDKAEFIGRLGYEFKAQQIVGDVIASGPLTDTLGVRLAVHGSNMWGGYFRNSANPVTFDTFDIATGKVNPHIAGPAPADTPKEQELLGRLTLRWKPTDRFQAMLKASADYNETNNPSWNAVTFNCPGGVSSLNGSDACNRDFVIHQNAIPADIATGIPFAKKDGSPYNTYRSYTATGSLTYKLDKATITSVSNYQYNRNQWSGDGDFQSSSNSIYATEKSSWRAVSSELRILTNLESPINFMVGGLYQNTKRIFDQNVIFSVVPLGPGLIAGVEDSAVGPATRYLSLTKNSQTKGETWSGFGQIIIKPTEKTEITAGGRYTHETKDSYYTQPYVNPALQAVYVPTARITANQTFTNFSPEVTASWKPSRDVLVYAAYRTAYKSGGFSNSGLYSAVSPNPVDDFTFSPETAKGFEVGIKSTLWDRQLRLNLGLYRFKYKDLQVDFFNSAIIAFQTYNAGSAVTKGVELELEYAPRGVKGFSIHSTVNYNDAKYENFQAPCYAGQLRTAGCTLVGPNGAPFQDLSGTSTALAPHWTGTLGAQRDIAVAPGMRLGLAIDARYSDHYLSSSFGNPFSRNPSYVTIDASVRLGRDDGRWELALLGKNLTNRFYVSGSVDGPSTGGGGVPADQIGFAALPRTAQLQLTVKY